MGTSLKLSDDLVNEARAEAEETDRSLTSQIEHWARLGRSVENALSHDDLAALKRADTVPLPPPTRRALLAVLRRVASGGFRAELSATLKSGRTVYQDASDGRIERIARNGERTFGRFVNRVFVPDEQHRRRRG